MTEKSLSLRKKLAMKIPKIEKLPSGTYFCRIRVGGVSTYVTAATESDCRKQAQLIKAEYAAGRAKRLYGNASQKTIRQLLDEYIDSRRNVISPSTLRSYESMAENQYYLIANLQFSRVKNWQKFVNETAARLSPKTMKNAWGLLSAAIRAQGLDVPRVTLPQVQSSEHPYLSPDQIPTFLSAIQGMPEETAILLALHGLRTSEVFGLQWGNIDLIRGTITINGARVYTKNGLVWKNTNKNATSRRVVPIMIPRLSELLSTQQKASGFVVDTQHRSMIYDAVNRACRSCGLQEVGAHGLRHSFASLAYSLRIPERDTMKLGGWSNVQTMHRIYTHIADQDVKNSAKKIADYFSSFEK